jgi:hypothetical protein
MSKETVSTLLTNLLFVVLVIGFAYMLIENTRLTMVNHRLESELVDSQNLANGYEWQLKQINRSNGWGGDE